MGRNLVSSQNKTFSICSFLILEATFCYVVQVDLKLMTLLWQPSEHCCVSNPCSKPFPAMSHCGPQDLTTSFMANKRWGPQGGRGLLRTCHRWPHKEISKCGAPVSLATAKSVWWERTHVIWNSGFLSFHQGANFPPLVPGKGSRIALCFRK